MKDKKQRIIGFILCVLVLAFFMYITPFASNSGPSNKHENPPHETHQAVGDTTDDRPVIKQETGVRAQNDDPEKLEIIESLKEKYGRVIHHPRIQLQAIEDLIRILKKLYPDSWQDHVKEYFAYAFPGYESELFDMYMKISAYSQWADENRDALSGLPLYQIKELIRDKREAIFGDEASIIWEMELKKDQVKGALIDLEGQGDLTFNEKADYYNAKLNEIYGDMSQAYITVHQQELINTFLAVDSVQDDLHAMTDEERKDQLTDLRKSMGFGDDALKRWNHLDEERDSRWANGTAYMQSREELLKTAKGEDLENKLDELRKKYFGETLSETIKQEEASGMYRFTRKRLYGKN